MTELEAFVCNGPSSKLDKFPQNGQICIKSCTLVYKCPYNIPTIALHTKTLAEMVAMSDLVGCNPELLAIVLVNLPVCPDMRRF